MQVAETLSPFETAYPNNYLLYSGRAGGLAVYDALSQHREHLGKMFGENYTFTWNTVTKKLLLHLKVKNPMIQFIPCI